MRRVLTAADPGGLRSAGYTGRAERPIFDRRTEEWATVEVYLFVARVGSHDIEFRVNPEFADVDAARVEVDAFAPALGCLPAVPALGGQLRRHQRRRRARRGGIILHADLRVPTRFV